MNEEEWQDVASPRAGDYTERLRVPGGWLYRIVVDARCLNSDATNDTLAVALVFVPAP